MPTDRRHGNGKVDGTDASDGSGAASGFIPLFRRPMVLTFPTNNAVFCEHIILEANASDKGKNKRKSEKDTTQSISDSSNCMGAAPGLSRFRFHC